MWEAEDGNYNITYFYKTYFYFSVSPRVYHCFGRVTFLYQQYNKISYIDSAFLFGILQTSILECLMFLLLSKIETLVICPFYFYLCFIKLYFAAVLTTKFPPCFREVISFSIILSVEMTLILKYFFPPENKLVWPYLYKSLRRGS